MHKVYDYSKRMNEEIQRIVENLFLIKILNKDKDEVNNFNKTVNNLIKSELIILAWYDQFLHTWL